MQSTRLLKEFIAPKRYPLILGNSLIRGQYREPFLSKMLLGGSGGLSK